MSCYECYVTQPAAQTLGNLHTYPSGRGAKLAHVINNIPRTAISSPGKCRLQKHTFPDLVATYIIIPNQIPCDLVHIVKVTDVVSINVGAVLTLARDQILRLFCRMINRSLDLSLLLAMGTRKSMFSIISSIYNIAYILQNNKFIIQPITTPKFIFDVLLYYQYVRVHLIIFL